jgi:hypothetical protein
MPETITLRWGGPAGAASGSRYRIEVTLDWATWTELAAAQAATSPYASVTAVLASDVDYGATTVAMVSAGSLAPALPQSRPHMSRPPNATYIPAEAA